MSIEADEVMRIAHLARIALEPETVSSDARELSAILNFVEQLETVDTSAVRPLAHPLDAVQRLRADEITESNQRDRLLALAPQTGAGMYLVPKVIE